MLDPPVSRKRREGMIAQQLVRRGIVDPRVLDAMQKVPREEFIPSKDPELAYQDGPLPIGDGQTISQPYMVAVMGHLLHLKGDETVLEIGAGSGYSAAVLSLLAKRVVALERLPPLLHQVKARWQALGLHNIHGIIGDGTLGAVEEAPYDGISVTAGAPSIPKPLIQQLRRGRGRLVIPVGTRFSQTLLSVVVDAQGVATVEEHFSCIFVPLIGQEGWETSKNW